MCSFLAHPVCYVSCWRANYCFVNRFFCLRGAHCKRQESRQQTLTDVSDTMKSVVYRYGRRDSSAVFSVNTAHGWRDSRTLQYKTGLVNAAAETARDCSDCQSVCLPWWRSKLPGFVHHIHVHRCCRCCYMVPVMPTCQFYRRHSGRDAHSSTVCRYTFTWTRDCRSSVSFCIIMIFVSPRITVYCARLVTDAAVERNAVLKNVRCWVTWDRNLHVHNHV